MEIDLTPRSAAASRVSLSIIIMPGQANPYGTLHGGVMLRLADECGAIAALRHVGMEPVLVVNLALKFDSLHDWHEQSVRHHAALKQLFSAQCFGTVVRRRGQSVSPWDVRWWRARR